MQILYYVINFIILLTLIALFFGKKIISMFCERRKQINSQLDAALSAEIVEDDFTMPEDDFSDINSISDEIISEYRRKIENLNLNGEQECKEIKINFTEKLRKTSLEIFEEQVKSIFGQITSPENEAKRNEKIIDCILSSVALTPGDMSYLKQHDVLYVTLSSKYPLSEKSVKEVDRFTSELLEKSGGKTSFWVKEDETMTGGVMLRIGDTVYDGSVDEKIYRFKKSIEKQDITDCDDFDSIFALFKEKSSEKHQDFYIYQRGRVISVSDGICWMDGLSDIMYGEVVEFECGERGMVLDIRHDRIGCVIFGSYEHIESYTKVRRVGRIASVPVGEGMFGRIVDAVGKPIDGKGYMSYTEKRPIEFSSPGILDREKVNSPLHTGIKAIDALVPIGKGQRELIIGDRQTGKTSIVLDTIINQKGKNVVCIYVAIGQKETSVSDFREKLELNGALDYTIIVAATASGSAAMQYIAPFAATAIGEYFMYSGRDVLIIYDDLSKHAVAYRELSLLLQRPSGREAYPGDIFYLHSRLLERSAHLSKEKNGGSMTALPIIETQAGDISSYIPTNVISITDGQIFLESELFHEGQRPAVNVGLSVSRVGGSAQTKLLKQVSSSLRTKLAQYRELAEFTQFGTDIDDETKQTLNSGKHLTEALKQNCFSPLDDYKQAVILYAVSEGFADNVKIEELSVFENDLYDELEKHPGVLSILKSGNKMTKDFEETLGNIIKSVAERY